MIFDKIVTLESPALIPVTSEIIEFLLPSRPENGIVRGGIKLIDVPGLIEGTTNNMSNIIKLIRRSIQEEEFSKDVINYILFFLQPAANFDNTSNFLRVLNESGIKVIFIINRDRPRENGAPNITKSTLIADLRIRGFNNLIKDNGSNILEVDLILGQQGRTNEIFRYIYNDLTHNNRFDDNVVNQINNLPVRDIYPYLHANFELFSRIFSIDDFIARGQRKADLIINGTIPLMIAVGFSPIPFVDVPIFLFLIATMLINIFKAYGFTIDIQILRNFFNNMRGHNQNVHVEEQE